jgi:hypothetical protein
VDGSYPVLLKNKKKTKNKQTWWKESNKHSVHHGRRLNSTKSLILLMFVFVFGRVVAVISPANINRERKNDDVTHCITLFH